MPLAYHITDGSAPDDALAEYYEKQEDGTYLLQVAGLAPPQPEPAEKTDANKAPDEGAAIKTTCHGAGTNHGAVMPARTHHTIIAPDDSDAISNSLAAIASGAVRLGS